MENNEFLSISEIAVKILLSYIPVIGGPISTIVGDLSQERYKKG